MGLTHLLYRETILPEQEFIKAAKDCKKVCAATKIKLIGPNECAPQFNSEMIFINGTGRDGYEPFIVGRVYDCPGRSAITRNHKRLEFSFCKTNGNPYDICVQVCLIVLKQHLGQRVVVRSDRDSKGWDSARKLCQDTLGYGKEFELDEDEEA